MTPEAFWIKAHWLPRPLPFLRPELLLNIQFYRLSLRLYFIFFTCVHSRIAGALHNGGGMRAGRRLMCAGRVPAQGRRTAARPAGDRFPAALEKQNASEEVGMSVAAVEELSVRGRGDNAGGRRSTPLRVALIGAQGQPAIPRPSTVTHVAMLALRHLGRGGRRSLRSCAA